MIRLRAALEDETRRSMSYAEFESLCEDCGMDKADASKVSLVSLSFTIAWTFDFDFDFGLSTFRYLVVRR